MAAADDRSPAVKANQILFMCLTIITFSLRAWVRGRILKHFGIDDLLTFVSLVRPKSRCHQTSLLHIASLYPHTFTHALMLDRR